MCDALNSLANKNVTLQKFQVEDFKLTEQQMKEKYDIIENNVDNQEESERTVFPKYIPEDDNS